jgi:hypothetical protein
MQPPHEHLLKQVRARIYLKRGNDREHNRTSKRTKWILSVRSYNSETAVERQLQLGFVGSCLAPGPGDLFLNSKLLGGKHDALGILLATRPRVEAGTITRGTAKASGLVSSSTTLGFINIKFPGKLRDHLHARLPNSERT